MHTIIDVMVQLLPSVIVALLIYLLFNLQKVAKKGGKVAIALGMFFQMFIPDPKVQQTIEMVVKQKERKMAEQEQQGEKNNID